MDCADRAIVSFGSVFEMPYCEEHKEQVTEIAAARVKKILRGE